jgi:hypothetical protein
MKISIRLMVEKLGVAIFILLFILLPSVLVLGDNDEGKNIITAYSGCVLSADGFDGTSPCFGIEYEKMNPGFNSSFSVSVGYLTSIGPVRYSYASSEFYESLGHYSDFSYISRPGFGLIFNAGFYRYFAPFNKKNTYTWFLYLGVSYRRFQGDHKAFDNVSARTESLTLSNYRYSLLDVGLGYRRRFGEHYSLKAEGRLKGLFPRGDAVFLSFLLGLSYRF